MLFGWTKFLLTLKVCVCYFSFPFWSRVSIFCNCFIFESVVICIISVWFGQWIYYCDYNCCFTSLWMYIRIIIKPSLYVIACNSGPGFPQHLLIFISIQTRHDRKSDNKGSWKSKSSYQIQPNQNVSSVTTHPYSVAGKSAIKST